MYERERDLELKSLIREKCRETEEEREKEESMKLEIIKKKERA